jgi:hypothetical protein
MVLAVGLVASPAAGAQKQRSAAPAVQAAGIDQFFIISSIDLPQHRLVLKMPTEVTTVMLVTDKTIALGEKGEVLKLTDFRTGDTVYATSTAGPEGPVAVRIRKGAMTVEELHRRYLKY